MSSSTIYLGLDVHKDTITVAVLPIGAAAPTHVDRLSSDLAKLRRYCERLAAHGEIRACYEASGAGYVVQRAMTSWGFACEVIAPSLIPTKPGVQRKHAKRDATQLARLYRAGELTVVRVPTEAEERVRDVVRCRETFQREILKSRHYILTFLARRGFVYRDGTNWTSGHYEWLRQLAQATSPLATHDRTVFGEYLGLLEYKLSRRDELDRQIAELALTPALAGAVARLQCFRGVNLHAAMVLATELVDWRRFESPRQLMAYLGLVPREHSSGERERRGSLPKAGNAHCRHVLVQAAWAYRDQPKVGIALKRRQQGQSPQVIAHAWKSQHRWHKLSASRVSLPPADRRRGRRAGTGRLSLGRDAGPNATASDSMSPGGFDPAVSGGTTGGRSNPLSGTPRRVVQSPPLERAGSRRIQFLPRWWSDPLIGVYQQDSSSKTPPAPRIDLTQLSRA